MHTPKPIGVFDSGYGGLTVLRSIVRHLPEYDFIYLGDNARTPYGTRSFKTVYQYTLECVKILFNLGCHLVILACNTASAKALRTIQQLDLPLIDQNRRVLGVIRPTTEIIGTYTNTRHIGILGTTGTIQSDSYRIEINKFYPNVKVYQHPCPMWVPLVENNEHNSDGADYFVKKDVSALLSKNHLIDTILLACTHYPLLLDKIRAQLVNKNIEIISQGEIVARSLRDYLKRHPELESKCSKGSVLTFFTTDSVEVFEYQALHFFNSRIKAEYLEIQ